MLLTFVCEAGHKFKRVLESAVEVLKCQECPAIARRDYSEGKTLVDVVDVIDNGFMVKKVEYSANRTELLRKQGDDYGKMVKKRLGYEEE